MDVSERQRGERRLLHAPSSWVFKVVVWLQVMQGRRVDRSEAESGVGGLEMVPRWVTASGFFSPCVSLGLRALIGVVLC
jgi:hypothetical protein